MNKLVSKTIRKIALLLFVSSSIGLHAQTQEVRAKKFVGLVYMKGETDVAYYALSQKAPTTIVVAGPGTLTVNNRVRLENNEVQSTPYYLKYLMDEKLIISEKIGPQQRSSKMKYSGSLEGTPSKADKIKIKIPPGTHTIKFYKHKTEQKAHVRFLYEKKDDIQWTEVMPVDAIPQIGIHHLESGSKQNYHRINCSDGFRFASENATKVRVYFRSDFTYKMHEQDVVRLILKKKDQQIATYKITSRKSNKVEYTNDNSSIPGRLEKVYIDIPVAQNETYELVLKESDRSGIIRVSTNATNKNTTKKVL